MVNVNGAAATVDGTNVTYRDTNAFMFFILWPAVTLLLFMIVGWQEWRIFRMRRRPPRTMTCSRSCRSGRRRRSRPSDISRNCSTGRTPSVHTEPV